MHSATQSRPFTLGCLLASLGAVLLAVPAQAQPFAYVTNSGESSVSVIDTAGDMVIATVGVGNRPIGVVFTPNGSRVYVTNSGSDTVSVIDTLTNTVVADVAVGSFPQGLAFTPDGTRAYVGSSFSNAVSVIDTATNTVFDTIDIGRDSTAVAITPDGSRAYLGPNAQLLAMTPDGSRVYVACFGANSVFAIDTATNTVSATVGVGAAPVGVAMRPLIPHIHSPVADTYVRAGASAAANFGAAPTLLAKKGISPDNTSRTYVTFDVSGVAGVVQAALRAYGRVSNTSTPAVKVTVYAVADTTWKENEVTWNTRPDLDAVLGTITVAGVAPRWLEINITKFLRAERAAGHDTVTLALRSVDHTSAPATFNSREATSATPQLLIRR